MSLRRFTNNATTTLASAITNSATSMSVTAGTGALFPSITGAQYFSVTLMTITSGVVTAQEIVLVTARSTDTMTITRAQEGTAAQAWGASTTVALLPTAAGMYSFAQFDDLQAQSGNYAVDTGTANAYSVALTPALTAHVTGAPIRWKAANTNTGASTFNDGVGSVSLTLPSGLALGPGAIKAGGIYVSSWDGAKFQLESSGAPAFSGTFTGTLNGFVSGTAPSGTFEWSLVNNIATIYYVGLANLTGTSNDITLNLTGVPAVLATAIANPVYALTSGYVLDNNQPTLAGLLVQSGPLYSLQKILVIAGATLGYEGASFQSSGVKGINSGFMAQWPIS
jgi:hypothetical protein